MDGHDLITKEETVLSADKRLSDQLHRPTYISPQPLKAQSL